MLCKCPSQGIFPVDGTGQWGSSRRRGRRGKSALFRLEDEDEDEAKDNEQQEKDTFPLAGVFLVSNVVIRKKKRKRRKNGLCSDSQVLDGIFHLDRSLLDIVFDAVKEGALIDDKNGEVFEELC